MVDGATRGFQVPSAFFSREVASRYSHPVTETVFFFFSPSAGGTVCAIVHLVSDTANRLFPPPPSIVLSLT